MLVERLDDGTPAIVTTAHQAVLHFSWEGVSEKENIRSATDFIGRIRTPDPHYERSTTATNSANVTLYGYFGKISVVMHSVIWSFLTQ